MSIVWAPLEHWKTAYSLIRLSITVTLLELQDLLILPWSIATKNLINPKKSQKRTWWSSLSFSDALEIFKRPSEGGPPCSILFFSKRSIHQEEVVGAHAWLKTNKVTVIRRPNLTWWASRLFFSVLVMLVVLIRFNLPLLSTQSIKSLIADIRLLWKEK